MSASVSTVTELPILDKGCGARLATTTTSSNESSFSAGSAGGAMAMLRRANAHGAQAYAKGKTLVFTAAP
jgi:hypothetical protein